MTSLNARRSTKSRKAKRGGRYRLKAHDLCGPCWRAYCAQFWVHAGNERAKDQGNSHATQGVWVRWDSAKALDGSLSSSKEVM